MDFRADMEKTAESVIMANDEKPVPDRSSHGVGPQISVVAIR
jgi:hypothetical protein